MDSSTSNEICDRCGHPENRHRVIDEPGSQRRYCLECIEAKGPCA